MESSSEKIEFLPPSYTSCVTDKISTVSPGLDQFDRIVENHEKLHFHSPIGIVGCTMPDVVQIRDAAESPILSIIMGRNRSVAKEIMTPSGEALITVSGGNIRCTLSAGDQVLGIIEDDSLLCRQTLKAKNVMGEVIFDGVGDHNVRDSGWNCCLECGFGCCTPNSNEVTFGHNGVTIAQLKRSTDNSSGNELTLFNSTDMDPRTRALIIYASYLAFLMFFVDTKCGRIGDRGVGRRTCLILIVPCLLLMSLPFFFLL